MKTNIPCKISFSKTDKCWYVESPGLYDGYMTYGNTLEEAKSMAVEAVSGLLETYLEHGDKFTIPKGKSSPDWYNIEIEPSMAFALWLRNARISNNMTLAEVAEKMGVKYQVYQKLENPQTANPTLKTLKKLETIFGQELVLV
ncbi:MAG: type II toxin-antitoxin system HicB family antitoxin [Spirochaetaceae bacterium]|nr:type II toxin-antitoxin system HicB family antitoxin [Spirochaetaceae bacterium]